MRFKSNILQFVSCSLFLIIIGCRLESYEPVGPNLKDKIDIKIHLVNECEKGRLEKPILVNGHKIINICSDPIISNNDFKSIKIVKSPYHKNIYGIGVSFKNPEKLQRITSIMGQTWLFYLNNNIETAYEMRVEIKKGYLDFGGYKVDEITKLIGKANYDLYLKAWAGN